MNSNSQISSPQGLPGQIGDAVPKNPYGESTRNPPQMAPYYSPQAQQGQQMVYQVSAAAYGYPDPNYQYYGMPYYNAPNQFAYADGAAYGHHPQQVAHQQRMRQAQPMPPQPQPQTLPPAQHVQQQVQQQVQKQVQKQVAQQAAQQQQQKLRASPIIKEEEMPFKFVAPAKEATGKTLFQFPFFVNGNEDDFYAAKLKRNKLREAELKDLPKEVPADIQERLNNASAGFAPQVAAAVATAEVKAEEKPAQTAEAKAESVNEEGLPSKSSEKEVEKTEQKIKDAESPAEVEEKKEAKKSAPPSEELEKKEAETPVNEQTEEFSPEKEAPVSAPKPSKPESVDWSALASKNAAGSTAKKDKKTVSANATFIPITPPTSASGTPSVAPQKKKTSYTPSSPNDQTKQDLGIVSLRSMLIDDYMTYVLKNNVDLLKKSFIPRGIVNISNTCFMSSVLQVLLFCEPFTKLLAVLQAESNDLEDADCPMLKALLKFFDNFHEKKDTSISPKEFFDQMRVLSKFKDLRLGQQEDAEEFLTQLLDQLHEELVASIKILTPSQVEELLKTASNDEYLEHSYLMNLDKYKNAAFFKDDVAGTLRKQIDEHLNMVGSDDEWHVAGKKTNTKNTASKRTTEVEPSPVSLIFGGQTKSVLKNPNNKKEPVSITYDPVQTIQLDISSKDITTLSEAFEKYNEEETIVFDRNFSNSSKQTFLYKLPEVMMIQLKRFEFVSNDSSKNSEMTNYNQRYGHAKKINKKIEYELSFEIPKGVISDDAEEQKNGYNLTGVIYHHGSTPSSGHYTCDIFNKSNGKWYSVDDDKVTESSKADVLKCGGESSKTAYILLYTRA
ncbi:hypothetical protein ACO0QE_002845 [Hanseniaspora vineae]